MTRTVLDSAQPDVSQRPINFTTWSPRTAAIVAGISLAVMAVLGGFGNFGAFVPLITPR